MLTNTTNTSISENQNDADVLIYPNPSNGQFKITVNINQNIKSEIIIYDVLGNIIYRINSKGQQITNIDLSKQATGIYFVQVVIDNNEIYNSKILIIR